VVKIANKKQSMMKKNRNRILVTPLLLVGILLLFTTGCEKEYSLPTVTTAEVTNIGQVEATGGGMVTDDGGDAVIARGICYSTNPGPTLNELAENTTYDGEGIGEFTSEMSNLSFGTNYYVRAFAINKEKGIAYGNEVTFKTTSPEGVDCPADLWAGDLKCEDLVWESYAPTYCTGEKMGDCSLLKITFDFWGYGSSAELVLELKLESLDLETYEGEVSLTKDATVTAEGSDITFHAGAVGTYRVLQGEILLDIPWSGYDAPTSYKFRITTL
jgi:hypothetical protein